MDSFQGMTKEVFMQFDPKKVAVLGGGHGAHCMAANLASRGFKVNMFEMPEFKRNLSMLFETKTIEIDGCKKGRYTLEKVTSDIHEAIDGVRYILIVTPAFAHKTYANLLKGKTDSRNQTIILYPGAFAGLLFKTIFGDDCPVVAEANNLPYDTRLVEPGRVMLYGFNNINIAFLPASRGEALFEQVKALHPFVRMYEDVLEAGLSIVNPAFHAGLCLFSINDIENWPKRPFFLYEHGVTPSSVKMNIELDNERKAIGRVFGYNLRPIEDFSSLPEGYTWRDLYKAIHGDISLTSISGPHNIDSRYLTEDAPYGLVPWSHIGRIGGVKTTYIDTIVNIYNVIHEKNWWEEGRNMQDLGLDGMSVTEIKNYLRSGKK
jgi:opine dehydrogenase